MSFLQFSHLSWLQPWINLVLILIKLWPTKCAKKVQKQSVGCHPASGHSQCRTDFTEPTDRQKALCSDTARKRLLWIVVLTITAVFINFLWVRVSFTVWQAIHRMLSLYVSSLSSWHLLSHPGKCWQDSHGRGIHPRDRGILEGKSCLSASC